MPLKSESQKQLDALAKQDEQDRKYAGPAVVDYGTVGSSGAMIEFKKQEIESTARQKMTPSEFKEYKRRTTK